MVSLHVATKAEPKVAIMPGCERNGTLKGGEKDGGRRGGIQGAKRQSRGLDRWPRRDSQPDVRGCQHRGCGAREVLRRSTAQD